MEREAAERAVVELLRIVGKAPAGPGRGGSGGSGGNGSTGSSDGSGADGGDGSGVMRRAKLRERVWRAALMLLTL